MAAFMSKLQEGWYFRDEYRAVQGPVPVGEILFMVEDGRLHE